MAKTILEALNELVEKQGGNTEDNKLIVDALNDLVESGGGSSGGGVIFVIKRDANDVADKTYREAGEACLANKTIIMLESVRTIDGNHVSTQCYFKMNAEVNVNVDESRNITSVSGSDGQKGFSSQENLDDLIVFYTE